MFLEAMKKISLSILIFFVFSVLCFGQSKVDSAFHKQKTSAYVSSNFGLGIPTNGFYMEELSGGPGAGSYGTMGYTMNISGGIPIAHSHFGITGLISYNAEPFNVNQCFLDLCDKTNTNQLVSSSYSDFKEMLLMAGIFFSTGGKHRIDFKILTGDMLSSTAGYSLVGTSSSTYGVGLPGGGVSTYTSTEDITSSLQQVTSSEIAFDFGVDVRFIQGAHFFAVLSSDFMWSQSYINTKYNESNQYNAIWSGYPGHYRVNYNLLSFTAGIGYKF